MAVLIKGNLSSRMYKFVTGINYNTEPKNSLIIIGSNYSRAVIFAI